MNVNFHSTTDSVTVCFNPLKELSIKDKASLFCALYVEMVRANPSLALTRAEAKKFDALYCAWAEGRTEEAK